MKNPNISVIACAALLLTGTVQAGSITCGDAMITDDQPDGQFTATDPRSMRAADVEGRRRLDL